MKHGRSYDSIACEALDEGGYVATSLDVPGLVAEGRSMAKVLEIARDVARKIAESCIEHGDPLPPALQGESLQFFGKRLLM